MYTLEEHDAFGGVRIVHQHSIEPKLNLARHFYPKIDLALQTVVTTAAWEIANHGYAAQLSLPLDRPGTSAWYAVSTDIDGAFPLFEVTFELDFSQHQLIIVDGIVFD